MSIKITVSDKVRCKVSGTIADASGPQPFDFSFVARRLSADELADQLTNSDQLVEEFLAGVIESWQGVKAEAGEIPYSREALGQLLQIPGIGRLMLGAYITDCGARAKN
jgi:hypothetical protein